MDVGSILHETIEVQQTNLRKKFTQSLRGWNESIINQDYCFII